jgi:ElaB/YqjD/DUF883 family membrane-anchored ribosome-binding protein
MHMNSHTSTDSALEGSRRYATEAIDRASDRMRELSGSMKDLAGRGVSSMGDGAQAAQRHIGRYANATGRYVMEQPLKSALIAAAVGAAVAGLVLAMRRNRSGF